MAPSKESAALKELFEGFAAAFPADGDPYLSRAIYDQVHKAATEASGVAYEDTTAGGRPCIWIRPESASTKHVILFMHGGGFSFGSPNGHRKLAAHLAKACNFDYRLTPENPYPAPLDDCVAAYKWLLDQGYEAKNIVVAGDSCGGGLSTSLPLAAVQQGLPNPGAAVSLSPWYDLTCKNGESFSSNEQNDVLNTKEFVQVIADRYVAGGTSKEDPLVSPLFADLSGLPPTWISVGGFDMLRDQGVLLAEKAKKEGAEVVLEVHEGQQHVMEFMAGNAPEADESLRRIGQWVREKIGS
ncbi:ATP synthase mitochondrial F1 complex assembly factor 2 [Vermiconidia calcicola]|uniref:ATP synthase mitochondrial F1 complex assembly factor 2 n=1 Tax=Vermiconidia calcicola TaxID=1690605 RepID=A0ACC3NIN6_9PEZI|nr:ATP synthase mitochondrial F1 complex assembly factor 2 [Vermiconidia calcicola]